MILGLGLRIIPPLRTICLGAPLEETTRCCSLFYFYFLLCRTSGRLVSWSVRFVWEHHSKKHNDGDDDDDDNEELSKPESNEDKDDEDEDIEDDDKDDALASEGYSQEGDDSEISNANNNVIDQDNEDSDQDGNGFSSPLKTLNRMKPSKNGSSVGHIATRANKKKEKNPTASTSNGPQKHPYGGKNPPQSNNSKKDPNYVSSTSKNAKTEYEELRSCLSYLKKREEEIIFLKMEPLRRKSRQYPRNWRQRRRP